MEHKRIEILLIESDQPQADRIRDLLGASTKEQFSLVQVRSLAQGMELLESRDFGCVLVDLALSGSDGAESLAAVRGSSRQTPVVALIDPGREQQRGAAPELEVEDYLVKGEITPPLLSRAISSAVDRKRVAGQLSEMEERLRFATEAAEIGVWHWDLERGELTWSARCKMLFGYPPDYPMSYQAFLARIDEADRAMVDAAVHRALQDKQEYWVEMQVLLPGGSRRWVMSKGRGSYDAQGRPLRMDGIAFDITSRKQAELALAQAKEQWERTFDTVPDLIAIMDAERNIVRVNRAMAERVGLPAAQCEGHPCRRIIHDSLMPAACCPHPDTLADGREHRAEVFAPERGEYFLVSTTPLASPDGSVLGTVHVARDITETKLAERKIKELNGELTRRAAELEEANTELECFGFSVAHDLRQPLNIINGYCQSLEMLHGRELAPAALEMVRQIYRSVLRMSDLIDSLLNFSRTGRVDLHRERVDLSALARLVADELAKGEPTRGQVSFRIEPGVVVEGDAELLRIVLDNLLGNAWKFTANREHAEIRFGAEEREGRSVCFVRDNGPGFGMADAEKLFVPFQRLAGAKAGTGFGIGLATVQRIIMRHGGRIWAEGVPGRGATFYFTVS